MYSKQSSSKSLYWTDDKSENLLSRARVRHERLFHQALQESEPSEYADPLYCEKLRRLVLIVGSSRSGSSWLADVLQGSYNCCSLPGEVDPLLLLSVPHKHELLRTEPSDALGASDVNAHLSEKMSLLLSWMAGSRKIRSDYWHLSIRQRFEIAMRTIWQWPDMCMDANHLLHIISLCFDCSNYESSPDYAMLNYLRCLKASHEMSINPFYYDLPYWLIRRAFPDEELPSGPPSDAGVLEEPPFIPFKPWVALVPKQRLKNPLILKSPSNSYRLNFFRTLFPNAEMILVHVVREPIDSITGLMSGWKHHGFFKHRFKRGSVSIEGYSDLYIPWTCEWWKFDLPPGWSKYAHKPLVEVCTYQWLSANNHVLCWAREHASECTYIQLQYEDMIKDLRHEVLKIFNAINVVPDIGLISSLRGDRRTMVSSGMPEELRKTWRREAENMRCCPEVIEVEQSITEARYTLAKSSGNL